LHRLCWKCNCSCVLSRLRNKSSKVYKISPVLNKIMLKIILLCFFVDKVYVSQKLWYLRYTRGFWPILETKSNSTRSILSNSTKSTELNMFNYGDNVDRDKLSTATLSPICTDERQSRNDITSDWIITWLINIHRSCRSTLVQQSRTRRRQSTFDK